MYDLYVYYGMVTGWVLHPVSFSSKEAALKFALEVHKDKYFDIRKVK